METVPELWSSVEAIDGGNPLFTPFLPVKLDKTFTLQRENPGSCCGRAINHRRTVLLRAMSGTHAHTHTHCLLPAVPELLRPNPGNAGANYY